MKPSLPLVLCRILIIILIIATVGCFCLSMIDYGTTSDLKEEDRLELINSKTFRRSVEAMEKFESFGGDIDEVVYIKYLSTANRSIVCFGTSLFSDNIYVDVSHKYEKVTKDDYDDLYYSNHHRGETVYSGVALKLIKEIVLSENKDETLWEWRKEELTCYKFVKKVLSFSELWKNLENITGISTVYYKSDSLLHPGIVIIRIEINGSDNPLYYCSPDSLQASMMSTTEDMYYSYKSVPTAEEQIYTTDDIDMILEEKGVERYGAN